MWEQNITIAPRSPPNVGIYGGRCGLFILIGVVVELLETHDPVLENMKITTVLSWPLQRAVVMRCGRRNAQPAASVTDYNAVISEVYNIYIEIGNEGYLYGLPAITIEFDVVCRILERL